MHLATTKLFADQNDRSILYYEGAKYFANILLPYAPFVNRLFEQLPSLNLDINMIAPDHGPIWRKPDDIKFILESWQKWAQQNYYQKAVIIYDTMWNSTAKMAASIADGLMGEKIETKVMPMAGSHRSDIITELLEAGALLVGSPTLNQQMFPTIAEILCYLKGLKPKNLIGQTFGSYGWGAEATKHIQNELVDMNIDLVAEPIIVKYVPTMGSLAKCRSLGKNIAQALQSKGQ